MMEFCEKCNGLLEPKKVGDQIELWCRDCAACPICYSSSLEVCKSNQDLEKKEINDEIRKFRNLDDKVRNNPRSFVEHPGPTLEAGRQMKNMNSIDYTISFVNEELKTKPGYGKIEIIEKQLYNIVKGRKCPNCRQESLTASDLPIDRFNDEQSTALIQCTECSYSVREGR